MDNPCNSYVTATALFHVRRGGKKAKNINILGSMILGIYNFWSCSQFSYQLRTEDKLVQLHKFMSNN